MAKGSGTSRQAQGSRSGQAARGSRQPRGAQKNAGATPSGAARNATSDQIEQQVVAFAEQLGRIIGTVKARTEGWLDGATLADELSRVRDSASSLLQQLGTSGSAQPAEHEGGTDASPAIGTSQAAASKAQPRPAQSAAPRARSGGFVDAPGKKHRKPTPNVPLRASAADARRAVQMKAVNASKRRGRG